MRYTTVTVLSALALVLTGAETAKAEVPPRVLQTLKTGADPEPHVLDEVPTSEVPLLREIIAAAAIAQEGVSQDCTDLVQNAFAVAGLTVRRDSGGPDYGVQQLGYFFGDKIPLSEAQPGDIAVTGADNGGHVWVILDASTNLGVHGGWGNLQTVITLDGAPLAGHDIYRIREGFKNDYGTSNSN